MLAAIALSPCAPVMVPELAGAAAAEISALRESAVAAAAALPDSWIAVGAGPDGAVFARVRGTFAGYGADVAVALSPPGPPGEPERATEFSALPLCALMAGWLRGQANPDASVSVRVYAADLDPQAAVSAGRDLRAEIDRNPAPVGVLVVADGLNTLGPSAPGGEDPGAPPVQAGLDEALACGDAQALAGLPAGVVGRAAYGVLAGLAGTDRMRAAEFYRGAPFGVGYFAGLWTPGESTG